MSYKEIQEPGQYPNIEPHGASMRAVRKFHVYFAGAGETWLTGLAEFSAAFPMGAAFQMASLVIPTLRIVGRQHTYLTGKCGEVVVNYSTMDENDITYHSEIGSRDVETPLDSAGNALGNDLDGNPYTANRYQPAIEFIYERTESDAGYFDGGIWIPWAAPGRYAWGKNAYSATDSQYKRVASTVGCVNSSFFLGGSDSDTWLFQGAEPREGVLDDGTQIWRVTYKFAFLPHADGISGWDWIMPIPPNTAKHIQRRDSAGSWQSAPAKGAFATNLQLTWPLREGGGYLV